MSYYLECDVHGEDAERFVIELNDDEFAALSAVASIGTLVFDGELDLPVGCTASSEQVALADTVLGDEIWVRDHADLRPSEIRAFQEAGTCLYAEIW